ncbi:PREDICTED: vesicle-associated membrane protein 8-like [Amphimedon queenslandica]|uniref:V-SNARE coiled-coil homology domain-containing protein n=1 Tax=Amphimedon queenslandica TaxID=400682 RepID=A0A1X7UUV8_AMPQE|nr:PREDICTED: vesicle-associated membrane protein 8-like [Amphimedon queenslandica]|eukprot:XP_019852136.1 PREDICTED: vesicle-associated membrane protein 8-like [Amphimedon queenslandica]
MEEDSTGENERLLAAQEKVKKVNEITRDNISKLMDRGDNLNDLQARTESLSDHAVNFSFTARRLKRKVCWKNVKLWFVLLFILMVILAVLIIALVAAVQKNKNKN